MMARRSAGESWRMFSTGGRESDCCGWWRRGADGVGSSVKELVVWCSGGWGEACECFALRAARAARHALILARARGL